MLDSKNTPESSGVKWGWFFLLGIVLMMAGAAAILVPFFMTLVVETFIGIAFVVSGIVLLIKIFSTSEDWNARLIFLILGIFNTVAGVLLIANPLDGIVTLTVVAIASFFINGLIRLYAGISTRPEQGSGWVMFGGVVSIVSSIYLAFNYPEISFVLMGIMAGISLISEGASYVVVSFMGKKIGD